MSGHLESVGRPSPDLHILLAPASSGPATGGIFDGIVLYFWWNI